MKDSHAAVTLDLLGSKRLPGRPVTGLAMTAAERKRRQRQRSGLGVLSVELPVELIEEFNEFLMFKDLTRAAVIEKLLRSQLLRKR